MQALTLNIPFCYVSASQAAWLEKFFRQPETTVEAYLADPNISASDPNPELFLLQLQLIGLLKIDGGGLIPVSKTCACYQLLNGLYIAGDDVDGDLFFLQSMCNDRYLSFLMEQDMHLEPLFLTRRQSAPEVGS